MEKLIKCNGLCFFARLYHIIVLVVIKSVNFQNYFTILIISNDNQVVVFFIKSQLY